MPLKILSKNPRRQRRATFCFWLLSSNCLIVLWKITSTRRGQVKKERSLGKLVDKKIFDFWQSAVFLLEVGAGEERGFPIFDLRDHGEDICLVS